jgi:hypothetical protein
MGRRVSIMRGRVSFVSRIPRRSSFLTRRRWWWVGLIVSMGWRRRVRIRPWRWWCRGAFTFVPS